jgi:predicted transcriptional regulator
MAHSENEMVKSKSYLSGYTVRDVLMKKYYTLNVSDKISDAVKMLLDVQATNFLILRDGEVAGTLSSENIIAGLSKNGKEMSISEAMDINFNSIDINTELDSIYPSIITKGNNIIPVFESGKLAGIIDGQNVIEFLLIKNLDGNIKKITEQ